MSNIIQIKRRASGGAAGAPASLRSGELAHNEADNILYVGKGDDGSGNATSITPVGGPGAFASSTRAISVASPLTGGGNLTADRSIGLDITGLTTIGTIDGADEFLVWDVSASAFRKVARSVLVGGGGTVTSVALAASSEFTVSGSPITGSGTLTLNKANQSANTVWAGPTSGGAATPGFRSLVVNDIPTLTASKISDFDTQVRTSRLDQMAAPTGAVSVNSQRIVNVAAPTGTTDAATKGYVDGLVQGLDLKDSVAAATTANVTLSGAQTIDGVSLTAGIRVLVKNQSTASQNGIYAVAAGAWTRTLDFNTGSSQSSAFVFVDGGSTQAGNGYVSNTTTNVGTTSTTFTQFSGAGQIVAGAGLVKSGNTLDVGGTANRIVVNADSIDIASNYQGQNTIITVGTITTGTWQGTAIAVANGGTGATNAGTARTNLGLGSMATQDANSVAITGGTIAGATLSTCTIDGGTF